MSKSISLALLLSSALALIPKVTVVDVPVVQEVTTEVQTTLYNVNAVDITTNAAVSCPTGYRPINAFACERVHNAAASQACRAGLRLTNGQCVGTEQHPPEFICPAGYERKVNECVKRVTQTASITCPSGYSLISNNCEKHNTTATVALCPDNYYLVRGQCVPTNAKGSAIQATPGCPVGSHVTAAEACLTIIRTQPVSGCPSGMKLNSISMCEGVYTSQPLGFCDVGYNLVMNNVCSRNVTEAPSLRCPEGFALESSAGATKSGIAMCERIEQVGVRATCPPGFTIRPDIFNADPSGVNACTKVTLQVNLPYVPENPPTDPLGNPEPLPQVPERIYNYIYQTPQVQQLYQPVVVQQKRFNLRL